jgi:hypothetical protein
MSDATALNVAMTENREKFGGLVPGGEPGMIAQQQPASTSRVLAGMPQQEDHPLAGLNKSARFGGVTEEQRKAATIEYLRQVNQTPPPTVQP